MADEPQLIVALDARLDKFEKALVQAGVIAQEQIDKIEGKFQKMQIGPGDASMTSAVAKGNLIAAAIEKAFTSAVESIKQTIGLLLEVGDVARRTATSFEALQRIKFAANVTGLDDKSMLSGIESLAGALEKMQRGETELSKLLDKNNIKYKDREGLVVGTDAALELAATLMERAGSEMEKINIARMFGLTKEWVEVLGKGVQHFRDMKKDAVITPELEEQIRQLNALRELVTLIGAEFSHWGSNLVKYTLPAIEATASVMVRFSEWLAEVGKGGAAEELFTRMRDRALEVSAAMSDIIEKARVPTQVTVTKSRVIYPKDEDKNAFDKAIESVDKHTTAMIAEGAAVGESARQQEEFRVQLLLSEALVRSGKEINDEYATTIANIAQRAGEAKEKLAILTAQQQELNSASKELGSSLSEAFKGAVLEGKKLNEVLNTLIKRMASKAIDKMFDLLFAVPAGGGSSPFLQLFKRQAGGPVEGGRPYIVGEKGPELFVPKTAGGIVPNQALRSARAGGGGVQVIVNNTTGQPSTQQERPGAGGDRVLEITIGRMVRDTIAGDLFRGGDIDKSMRARFGLTPKLA